MINQQLSVRQLERREPSGHLADEGHPAGTEIQQPRCREPPDDQNKGTGDAGLDHPQPEHDHERGSTDKHGRPLGVAQRPEPGPQLL